MRDRLNSTDTVSQTLWLKYRQDRSEEVRSQLLDHYMGLVKYIVKKFAVTPDRTNTSLEEKDLLQYGAIGLLDAIERFDPARGVKFESYAVTRIQGTIQDELRKLDWIPRSVRKQQRLTDEVVRHNQAHGCTGISADEIEGKFSLSYENYIDIVKQSGGFRMETNTLRDQEVVENLAADGSDDPYEMTRRDEIKRKLVEEVQKLPKRDRLIVTLYYYEGLTFGAIARIVRLTESRVSQIHAAALTALRRNCEGLI